MKNILTFLIAVVLLSACTTVEPPEPYGAVPSERQLAWHQMKYYAFIHFSPNTFTNKEWGYGDEPESIFNPTELDVRQWARVAKEVGMEGIVITSKHHDGFCLWPSSTTEHSIKNSPYKDGKGDIIQELRDACDEYGIKLGIYLSPWDRNHPTYGTPEYIEVYRTQLRELMTNYGEIYEFWMDGAMGGSGYYGGADETRKIDNKVYYDWPNTHKIVRELQPMAVMFSDGGPDVRWGGNEQGFAYDPNWSTVNTGAFYPGIGGVNQQLNDGHEDGGQWLPAEVNTSIRPGWFYHKTQDNQVKSLNQLIENWYHSVGMNGNFILNIPPDQRGLFHENDVARLKELKQYVDEAFDEDLAASADVSSSNNRGGAKAFGAKKAFDGDLETFWATDDEVKEASIEIELDEFSSVNCILIQEYITLGQRVNGFSVEVSIEGSYQQIGTGITIGNRRLLKFPTVGTDRIRVSFRGKASLAINNIEVYLVPEMIASPVIQRNLEGKVTITSDSPDPKYYYTTDGSEPTVESERYYGPFEFSKPGTINAKAFVKDGSVSSATVTADFDIVKTNWKLIAGGGSSWPTSLKNAIDDNPNSFWLSQRDKVEYPFKMRLDLGSIEKISGFRYLPRQDDQSDSNIFSYSLRISRDGKSWVTVLNNKEFSNIGNNPVLQKVLFNKEYSTQYLELTVHHNISSTKTINIAEIGVITR